jgi:hypothetical protein
MMRKLLASGLMLVGLAWSAVASTTNCVITVNLTNKSVTISSKLAIRETAYCAITNLGESDATNLVLRITKGTSAYVNATSFVAAASNKAFGAVDLNTSELTNFFYGMNPSVTRSFTLAIWDVALNRLLVNADVDIMNNPYVDGMPGPSPIGVNYLAYNQTNANWRVYGGNLQLYDMADTSWRTIMFRQGSVVAGPSNEPTGAATNIEAFTGMSVMIPYTVPNPQYGFIPSYKGDGLWEARSPTGLAYVVTWGEITGTLTNQADLQAVLDTIITNHNDFPDVQGGGASEYYHLTSADYASVTGGITSWDKAATDAAGATADVAVVQGRTGAWEQAVADAASWTNNALSVGNAVNLTNNVKWDKASTDAEGATGDVATLQGEMTDVQSRTSTWEKAAADAADATNRVTAMEGRTSVWEKAATDASDATNRVAVMEGSTSAWTKAVSDAADATNRVAVMEGSTSAWTKAASDGVDATNRIAIIEGSTQAWTKAVSDAEDATNRVTVIEGRTSVWEQAATDAASATGGVAVLQGRTSVWEQAATDAASATGDVAVLQGRTSVWDTAATDASAATNFLATNTLQSQITANATGKVGHVEHDAHTNLSLASGAHGGESDPVWAAASNLYATGTPVYVESDPVWSGVSGSVVYADDAGYTQAVEQASRALEWADAASNIASTAYGWGDHAGLYVEPNDAAYTNAVALAGTALQGATIAAGAANSVTTNAGVLSITWNTNDTAGGAGEALWVAASNQVQTDLDDLQTATNALNTRMGTAETATNALNTRVGTLETSTNDLNSRVGTIEGVTNAIVYTNTPNYTNAVAKSAKWDASEINIGTASTVADSYGIAIGWNAISAGNGGIAIGAISESGGTELSVAIGKGAKASNNAVAIGAYVRNDEPGSTKLSGNLNMSGAVVSNASLVQATTGTLANLTITGGTPTNGAVWVATNTNGQGTWSVPSAVYAQVGWGPFTVAYGGNVNVGYSNLVYNVGGAFDGTNWTPGALGWYAFDGSVCLDTIDSDVGAMVSLILMKNASALITRDYHLGKTRSSVTLSCVIYNNHVTNSYNFNLYNASGRTLTNQPEGSRNVFSGVLLRP